MAFAVHKWIWFTAIVGVLGAVIVGVYFMRWPRTARLNAPDVPLSIKRAFQTHPDLLIVGRFRNTPKLWRVLPRLAERMGVTITHLPWYVPQLMQLLGRDGWWIGRRAGDRMDWTVWTQPMPVLEKGLPVLHRVLPRGWTLRTVSPPRGCRTAFVLRMPAFAVPVHGSFCQTVLVLSAGPPVQWSTFRPLMRTVVPTRPQTLADSDLTVWWIPDRLPLTRWIRRVAPRIMPDQRDTRSNVPIVGTVHITDRTIEFRIGF